MKLSQLLSELHAEARHVGVDEDPDVMLLLNGRKPDEGDIIDIVHVHDWGQIGRILLHAERDEAAELRRRVADNLYAAVRGVIRD